MSVSRGESSRLACPNAQSIMWPVCPEMADASCQGAGRSARRRAGARARGEAGRGGVVGVPVCMTTARQYTAALRYAAISEECLSD